MESSKNKKSSIHHPDDKVALSEDDKRAAIRILKRLMEQGLFVVYADEDDTEETILIDCEERKRCCRSICCSFVFALTQEEVRKGTIQWNQKRPYFIEREADGYCPHLDRESLRCKIWEERPRRCQKYDCRKEQNVWTDFEEKVINEDVFKHLPQ